MKKLFLFKTAQEKLFQTYEKKTLKGDISVTNAVLTLAF